MFQRIEIDATLYSEFCNIEWRRRVGGPDRKPASFVTASAVALIPEILDAFLHHEDIGVQMGIRPFAVEACEMVVPVNIGPAGSYMFQVSSMVALNGSSRREYRGAEFIELVLWSWLRNRWHSPADGTLKKRRKQRCVRQKNEQKKES